MRKCLGKAGNNAAEIQTQFLYRKPTRCTITQIYLIKYSTCFGQVHCPSSAVSQHCTLAIGICHASSVGVGWRGHDGMLGEDARSSECQNTDTTCCQFSTLLYNRNSTFRLSDLNNFLNTQPIPFLIHRLIDEFFAHFPPHTTKTP